MLYFYLFNFEFPSISESEASVLLWLFSSVFSLTLFLFLFLFPQLERESWKKQKWRNWGARVRVRRVSKDEWGYYTMRECVSITLLTTKTILKTLIASNPFGRSFKALVYLKGTQFLFIYLILFCATVFLCVCCPFVWLPRKLMGKMEGLASWAPA